MVRPTGPRIRARTAAVVLGVVLAGCGRADAPPAVAPPTDASSGAPSGAPGDDPARPPVPGPCDAATQEAAAAPVLAQMDALGAGDFATAYAQASPFFRTVVDPERFAALITAEYPELLAVRDRRITGCTVLNRRALLVVAVTAASGARRTLAYELGETAEGWRIDGATDVAPPVPPPSAPQA